VFARGLDDQLVLVRIVTHRLFDKDVLASVERENRGGRVPVIRGRDHDGVHVLVVEDATDIDDAFRRLRLAAALSRRCDGFRQDGGVHVAHVSDFCIGVAGKGTREHHPATVQTHDGDYHPFVRRSIQREEGTGAGGREGGETGG
jgi:hypothetical protein